MSDSQIAAQRRFENKGGSRIAHTQLFSSLPTGRFAASGERRREGLSHKNASRFCERKMSCNALCPADSVIIWNTVEVVEEVMQSLINQDARESVRQWFHRSPLTKSYRDFEEFCHSAKGKMVLEYAIHRQNNG